MIAAMNVGMVLFERSFFVVPDQYRIFKNPRKNDQITSLQSNYKIEDTEMLIKNSSITYAGPQLLNDKSYECGNGPIWEILFCSIWLI